MRSVILIPFLDIEMDLSLLKNHMTPSRSDAMRAFVKIEEFGFMPGNFLPERKAARESNVTDGGGTDLFLWPVRRRC